MGTWLTPDTNPAPVYLSRVLFFRAELAGVISGQLELLSHDWYWEANGTMSVPETLIHITDMLEAYLTGGDMTRVGTLVHYVTLATPSGVLPCDGAIYNRVDYPALYAVLAPEFVIDPDTFSVPDLRGRVTVTSGTGNALTPRGLGDSLGAETVTLAEAEIPAHAHTEITAITALINGGLEAPAAASVPGLANTGLSGGGQAHQNMQPSLVVHTGVYYQ